jgi:hypothetical protein
MAWWGNGDHQTLIQLLRAEDRSPSRLSPRFRFMLTLLDISLRRLNLFRSTLFQTSLFLSILLATFLLGTSASTFAVSCPVAAPHAPSEAEAAFLKGDYDKAATLYQASWRSSRMMLQRSAGSSKFCFGSKRSPTQPNLSRRG